MHVKLGLHSHQKQVYMTVDQIVQEINCIPCQRFLVEACFQNAVALNFVI